MGGRARIGRSLEITGTRRGRCTARKVELTGGAARSVAEQASAVRASSADRWARVRRERSGARAGERGLRGAGLHCCWAELGGLGRRRLGVKRGLGRAGCWAGSGGEKVLG